ncbi:Lrp/AsnC family transcriptional regulator [Hamadaea tsunoensis]|uniref:Lrp/AsnC family transcriptional regulator n=1 Tax=Hamadaea tsunoensis TaxID=53368 RepID=UPI000483E15C|nr:Lrp/AsnC family transcriptional regulator [Hamadaea tsunoensis]
MPNEPRRTGPPPTPRPQGLDDLDRRLIDLLSNDGRLPNAALAEALGIAASTCLARLRALRERGVIRGFHADLDLALLGRPIQAMVSVRLAAHDREAVDRFRAIAPKLPGVLSVYHVTGSTDYLLHVAVGDPAGLRDVVLDRIVALPEVAHAETSLIFEHVRGEVPLA